jgi:hypothetical protein
VITKDYYANFDAFEFVFTTGSAEDETQISVWGKDSTGSPAIPIVAATTTIESITITGVPARSSIWLTGIVGWEAMAGNTAIQLQILRGATIIFSINEHAAGNNTFASSSVDHVDLTPGTGNVTYSLTVLTVVIY